MIIEADRDQDGFLHGGQLGKSEKELLQKVLQPGTGRDGFGDLGRSGQVFAEGIKMDAHLHDGRIGGVRL